jgi:hypothetical protein
MKFYRDGIAECCATGADVITNGQSGRIRTTQLIGQLAPDLIRTRGKEWKGAAVQENFDST